MSLLRYIFLISLYASLGAYRLYPADPARSRWLVQRTSTIRIAGSTNINQFCCQVDQYTGPDTITLSPTGISFLGVLSVNIADFNCNNRMMTAEFKKTLQYQRYPHLKISFISLDKAPAFGTAAEKVRGCVEVELAGAYRKFVVDYSACRTDNGNVELIGTRVFGFSDFGLTPPRKMAGLVRVNDRLEVEFRLHLHPIN
jgi:hypothetical protein